MYQAVSLLLCFTTSTFAATIIRDSQGFIDQKGYNGTAKKGLFPDPAPQVTLQNGTVIGMTDDGVDTWNAIPMAVPPTGRNRLKPPQALTSSFRTFEATTNNIPICPQFFFSSGAQSGPLVNAIASLLASAPVQGVLDETEDCLNLNVQRPAGTKEGDNLPVLVWFSGGGFVLGGTQFPPVYDGTPIIQKSVDLGKPIMYVAINYRVGGFGFLAGKEVMADGAANLGLKDQRFGLQWVQDNIAAFGGDPTKVTIWGESAGSISVFDQLMVNKGDNSYNGGKLFSGAIMNSGTAVPTLDADSAPAQNIYDQVVSTAKCSGASDTLDCLRGLDYDDILNAMNSVPALLSYHALDLSYLPRPDPTDNFFPVSPDTLLQTAGSGTGFTKVPVIIGDQEDEGSIFGLLTTNISTTDQMVDYFQTYFPNADRATVQELVDRYPEDPAQGSPFRTGDEYNYYPQAKRMNAIFGDAVFLLPRRIVLSVINNQVPAYSYLSIYNHDVPYVGTFHFSDVLEIFLGFPNKYPQEAALNYYISFISSGDPNTLLDHPTSPGLASPIPKTLPQWPKWDNATRTLATFDVDDTTMTTDDFRMAPYEWIAQQPDKFRV